MHNNDFDILFRSVHYSALLRIAKIKKCYLYSASLVFSFKFCLALNEQIFFGTPCLISH